MVTLTLAETSIVGATVSRARLEKRGGEDDDERRARARTGSVEDDGRKRERERALLRVSE